MRERHCLKVNVGINMIMRMTREREGELMCDMHVDGKKLEMVKKFI